MGYTVLELVRAAGFHVRRVSNGGTVAVDDGPYRFVQVGPESTGAELCELADRYIELPDASLIEPFEPAFCGTFALSL